MAQISDTDIAIIGMSGCFPKAKNIQEYWENLTGGINCSVKANEEEILASGYPKSILEDKRFVNVSSKLEEGKFFDAEFFGISNAEALLMDPQIRLLLQTSWHAIEDAGYDVQRLNTSVGNFCGMSTNSYLHKLLQTASLSEIGDALLYRILNEKDFLATWISYKLNLTGPTMSVQTACSTSLLAIHLASQSLLNFECDMALAGGVSFNSNENIGYVHVPESIYSKDGICKPFDKDASGITNGNGAGVVLLKRAKEAIKDGDHIYAIVKATAVNNDGANKQGYTTPSVDCQRDVVLEALGVADINPETIGMIEAHGTGTLIGDPIEVSALTESFREYTNKKQYCAIGSVKSNIGHLDAAAGIASTIKAVLCVNKGVLVPSINYEAPNPALELETSPFYVSQENKPWADHFEIRRAGVSSLGVGGTNVHIILEEPPKVTKEVIEEGSFVIGLSAKKAQNLALQKQQLASYIKENEALKLSDISYTSLYGRTMMPYRFSVVCHTKDELVEQLIGKQHENCFEGSGNTNKVVFLFPGQGSQYSYMSQELYRENEGYRKDMDYCFEYVKKAFNLDVKTIIFSNNSEKLNKTEHTQIALFIVEYCLSQQLKRSGVHPSAIIGHSLGEYVAACTVGCISLEDALTLVYHRGRLMGMMPEGGMLLIRLDKEELADIMLDTLSICADNGPNNIVIGGSVEDVRQQSLLFDINNIPYKKLAVSHAYHTQMMHNMLEEYETYLSSVAFNPFETKIYSTYTGKEVDSKTFCSKDYWLQQIMQPVQFSQAVENLSKNISNPIFVEVGPGGGLSHFVASIQGQDSTRIQLLPKTTDKKLLALSVSKAKAMLYAKGVQFEEPEVAVRSGKRISLPGYVFSKNYFWKPSLQVNYDTVEAIEEGYHYSNEEYQSERLTTSVEIVLNEQEQLSKEQLNAINNLHAQYLKDIKEVVNLKDEALQNAVSVFYRDNTASTKGDVEVSSKIGNKGRNLNTVFVAPTTEEELQITTYWEEILGYKPAGILDNYFEVGGNSLLATQLINKIAQEFEIELSISEVLTNNTIKELALIVAEKKWLSKEDEEDFANELII